MDLFAKWNKWLGEHIFIFVMLALLFGFVLPSGNTSQLRNIAIGLFSYMTFVTAMGTSLKEFWKVMTKPLIPIWILFIIHVVSPLLAWSIGTVLFPKDSYTRLGLLIGSSIPMAVTSIIWTSIAKGNVAVTMVAMTMDTFIVPFWLPFFLKYAVGKLVFIDFNKMVLDLLFMVTLPSMLGMLICDLTERKTDRFVNTFGGLSSKIGLIFVVFINAILIYPAITWNLHLIRILIAILLLVIGGYILGYLGSFILKEKRMDLITSFVYSVGMRNTSFGAVLAIAYFPAAVAIPVTLNMLFQQPLAAIVAQILKRRRKDNKECSLRRSESD